MARRARAFCLPFQRLAQRASRLTADGGARALELAAWRGHLAASWDAPFAADYGLALGALSARYDDQANQSLAKNLKGKLLIAWGTMDDNVHMQNSIQFAYELQQAGKPFEMMLYPRTKHTVTDEETLLHVQRTVLGFLRRTILATPSHSQTP